MRRFLAYAAIYIIWGGSFLAIRLLVAVVPPFFIAGVRFVIAGLFLYAYGRYRGAERPDRRRQRNAAALGLFMFAGNYACLFWSERFLPSGLAAILTSLIPVWILAAEWIAFRGAIVISKKALLGIFLGIAGVLLLAAPSGPTGAGLTFAAGILVLGTLFWAGGTVAGLRLALPRQVTTSAGLQMAWGGFFLLLLSGFSGEFRALGSLHNLWNWRLTISMVYLVVAASIVAFSAYVWLMAREPASRVASYACVNPVVALILGFVLGRERPTLLEYAGVLLVLVSVLLTLAGGRATQHAPIETVA